MAVLTDGYFYVLTGELPGAASCVCGRRGHRSLGRSLAACLAQTGAIGRAFYAAPGGTHRALSQLELDSLPHTTGQRGRPRTSRGTGGSYVTVRVSQDERDRLESEARRARLTLSDWVRTQLGLTPTRRPSLTAPPRKIPPEPKKS